MWQVMGTIPALCAHLSDDMGSRHGSTANAERDGCGGFASPRRQILNPQIAKKAN